MINIIGKIFFTLIAFLLFSCSFDNKTGIWGDSKKEKLRVAELEQRQNQRISVDKLYSTEILYNKEKNLKKKIILTQPKQASSWKMHGLNHQNFLGNIYLPKIDNKFINKKIGKNKFSLSKTYSSLLVYKKNIFFSDERGSVFSVSQYGKVNWKKNIYKKIYKRIYKNLSLAIDKDKIYVSDNLGFVYALNLISGELIWIKNHGIPFRSKIKIFGEDIFLLNQEDTLIAFNKKDGALAWKTRTVTSFIKSQNLLSVAITKDGDIVASNSSGDLFKANSKNGNIYWSINTVGSTLSHNTDFFKSSDIVLRDDIVIFSTQTSLFSIDLKTGYTNWEKKISSIGTPVIDKNNIFFITENGYFVIMNIDNGEVLSSTNILRLLKKKKRETKVTGFILGSEKIYAVTLNGYLIISSASSGKAENHIKIGDPIRSNPIISDRKLFLYTENSRIVGFN